MTKRLRHLYKLPPRLLRANGACRWHRPDRVRKPGRFESYESNEHKTGPLGRITAQNLRRRRRARARPAAIQKGALPMRRDDCEARGGARTQVLS